MTPPPPRSALALAAATLLAACAVGPDHQRPTAAIPVAYKESDGWRPSAPQAVSSAPWWTLFQDHTLDQLERRVAVTNQNVKAAEAAYRQALAAAQAAEASFFPTLGVSSAVERVRTHSSSTQKRGPIYQDSASLSLGLSWAPDLWGKLRRAAESADATAQAQAADLAAARLSAQAALATSYFQLRSLDAIKRLLDLSAEAYERSAQIARNQYAAGTVSQADVAQAETQLQSVRAQAVAVTAQRAQLEHAIAVLVGVPPAELSLPAGAAPAIPPPPPPVGLPSALLERRPDVAAAERLVAAANARIGVALAAYYPNITLGGAYGFTSTAASALLQAANTVWSVGPQLAVTLFDGGARRAQTEQARAAYDQEVAFYRQTVLTAFQQVEDGLSSLRILAEQAEIEQQALVSARAAEAILLNQYRAGIVSFTSVVTAQAAALSAEQATLTITRDRLTATVSLIAALGGGWTPDAPASQ